MMVSVVADNGEVMHSDITWKCWNAEGHADTRPPGNWMEYGFDDSAWPNAVSYGRNDADDTHWSAYIPRKPGYPETSGHVKPGISDEAEWIWTADPEVHNDVFCRGNFYSGDRLRSTPPPQPPLSPRDAGIRTTSAAMVSVVIDNSGSTYCNGKLMDNSNAWNLADTFSCVAVNNDYVIAIDGIDGEVDRAGVGGLMATVVADNGETLITNAQQWKCWNAQGHRDLTPPPNWMEIDFDDSSWCVYVYLVQSATFLYLLVVLFWCVLA
jgi:hypothetical protein